MAIDRDTQNVLLIQLLIVAVVAAIAGVVSGVSEAKAALFGGLIVASNTLLQLWHMRRAERIAKEDAERILRIVYRCAAERIFSTVALFLIGLVALKLDPFSLLMGFLAGQVAIVLTKYLLKFNVDQ